MLKVVRNLKTAYVVLVFALVFAVPFALSMIDDAVAENIDTNVRIEPSLTVNLPTTPLDITLDPATATFGTKTLNISVSTNNDRGYQLTMTSDSTDLVNIADSTKVIPTFDTATLPSGGYTTADFPENHWGYKQDSGNYQDFKTTQTVLQNNGRTNEDSTSLTFAAKIDFLQASGTYENTLVFTTTATPPIYMQDVDSTMCTTSLSTVVDKRDGSAYAIKKLADGNCWMVQNLNFIGSSSDAAGTMTLSSATSNVSRDVTISYADLTAGNSYDQARIHVSGNNVNGVWYNYAAATAGTITGSSNTTNATSDICPRGWRLPKNTEITTLTTSIGSDVSVFNPIIGSYYYGGGMEPYPTSGLWWGSTASTASRRDYLRYDEGGGLSLLNGDRVGGYYLRCVLDTRTLDDISTMQEMTPTIVANTASGATKNLIDNRDSQTYSVRKIDSDIWMTQNLALGYNASNPNQSTVSNLTAENTNISNSYTTASPYTLSAYNAKNYGTSGSYCYGTYTDGSTSGATGQAYTNPCIYSGTDSAGNKTVWYNFAAAAAGTISGINTTSAATTPSVYDICPKGWHIPNVTDGNNVVANMSSFNGVYGGVYYNGNALITNEGRWWLSDMYPGNSHTRSILRYPQSTGVLDIGNYARFPSLFVRCIAKR